MKPGDYVDVWTRSRSGFHVLKSMKWGLVPPYFRGYPNQWDGNTSHAKIETVSELPSFREAWTRRRRVIFPMGHYNQKTNGIPDLLGEPQEVRVDIGRSDGEPMAVCGIYSAIARGDSLFLSCAMLTRPASPGLEHINDRFPVMIEKRDVTAWLDGADDLDLLTPPPAELFSISLAA